MIFVTGLQSSGTSLWTKDLQIVQGIRMTTRDVDRVSEDPFFYRMTNNAIGHSGRWRFTTGEIVDHSTYPFPVRTERAIRRALRDERQEPWGFKHPSSGLMIWQYLSIIREYFEVEVHFVFREPKETIESFMRQHSVERRPNGHMYYIERNKPEGVSSELYLEWVWTERYLSMLNFYHDHKNLYRIHFIDGNQVGRESVLSDPERMLPASGSHELAAYTLTVYDMLLDLAEKDPWHREQKKS